MQLPVDILVMLFLNWTMLPSQQGRDLQPKASTLSSFFMNAEYNLNDKYYLSGSFRYDGSSRFGVNNKWAPFWSIGAKYRISNESFMENTKLVDRFDYQR